MKKHKNVEGDSPFGGEREECQNLLDIGQTVDCLPNVWDIMEVIEEKLSIIDRTKFPHYLKPGDTINFDDIGLHGRLRQRLSKGTVERNLRYMRFMETHMVPVDFRNPTLENWLNHIDYRERNEFNDCLDGKGVGAIRHEWQAMRMVLNAYGIKVWNYKPPQPADTFNEFPMPNQVHDIVNHKWSKDPYINALTQYYLCFNFVIGWRPPSEPAYMKKSFVDFDKGLIKIVEPKKRLRERKLRIPEIMQGSNVKSLQNWIDKWRSKIENQYSQDYLFLYPDGRPFWNEEKFNGDNLRMFINRIIYPDIKNIYPQYYNYCARHYCGVSRLLNSYHKTGNFDIYAVSSFLGHQKLNTTIGYVKDAELYIGDDYNFDWINRVLKAKYNCEENTVKKSVKPLKSCSSIRNPSRNLYAVCRTRTGDRSVNSRVLHQLS